MVPISFKHFVLGFMVLLLSLKDCDAYANRGIKKVVVEPGDGIIKPGMKKMHNGKQIYVIIQRFDENTSGLLGGRKLMMERREYLSNEVKKQESKKTSEEASKISGASSVGNSEHTWKRKLKMQSKFSSRSLRHHVKVKNMDGFVSLNADYHMAKTHPPRNN